MVRVENIQSDSHLLSEGLGAGQAVSRPSLPDRLELPFDNSRELVQGIGDTAERSEAVCSVPVWAGAPAVLKLNKILVPFDFSAASVRLLRCMISLADKLGATVTILHVVSPWVTPSASHAPYSYDENKERLENSRVLLRRLLRSLCEQHQSLGTHVVLGQPVDEILQFAHSTKPDLIALATHGSHLLRHLFLPATAERVIRQAQCPVLAMPESIVMRSGRAETSVCSAPRIVVPVNYSTNSAAALRFAGKLAEAQNAELHVFNFSGRKSSLAESARARLDEWVRSQLPSTGNVLKTLFEGEPSVYTLLRRAELLKADLIVLGPSGYAWTRRFRLNSTTDGILRHAPCPVISLRAGTHSAGH